MSYYIRERSQNGLFASPPGGPDALDLFKKPLGDDGIHFCGLLLRNPVRSINLGFFQVLAVSAHVCHDFRVINSCAHGVVRCVDLLELRQWDLCRLR
jgi:hypothetical protein